MTRRTADWDVNRYGYEGSWPTPQQWLNRFLDADEAIQLKRAEGILRDGQTASRCVQADHDALVEELAATHQRAADAYQRGWQAALEQMLQELDKDREKDPR